MTGHLQGKVALVTGGSLGIGKAAAEAFARDGARVVICGRNRETGERVAESIQASGGEATFIKADVSKAAEVEALVQGVIQKYDRLDC